MQTRSPCPHVGRTSCLGDSRCPLLTDGRIQCRPSWRDRPHCHRQHREL